MKKSKLTELVYIFKILKKTYGAQKCFLEHESTLELMVCAILSAQCTDAKVNMISPGLFRKYPKLGSFADADLGKLEKVIKPCGLYHAKAKNIINACKKIRDDFNGEIPSNMEKLTSLPGIGRKTANVILGQAFKIPGFPVDTHVFRLLNRIGVVKSQSPEKIEYVINENMPDKYWTEFSLLLIQHGRNRCRSRKPDCENCEIRKLCKKII